MITLSESWKEKQYSVHSWDEIRDAVNKINNKHRKMVGLPEEVDYVAATHDVLPIGIVQVLAMECAFETPYDDPDLRIVIDAYRQLQAEGHVGNKE